MTEPKASHPTENLYEPNKIRTFTGKYIDPFNLTVEDISLEDIAHGLFNMPRFAGHLPHFYPVLAHSIMVGDALPDEHKLAGYLHDAPEALGLGDIPSPIKKRLPDYKKLEEHVISVVAKKFGFEYPLHPLVKTYDRSCLEWEWEHYMLKGEKPPLRVNSALLKGDFISRIKYILNERNNK